MYGLGSLWRIVGCMVIGVIGAVKVQANQVLIIHKDEGMLLDPGGHKVFFQSFFPSLLFIYHQVR